MVLIYNPLVMELSIHFTLMGDGIGKERYRNSEENLNLAFSCKMGIHCSLFPSLLSLVISVLPRIFCYSKVMHPRTLNVHAS